MFNFDVFSALKPPHTGTCSQAMPVVPLCFIVRKAPTVHLMGICSLGGRRC